MIARGTQGVGMEADLSTRAGLAVVLLTVTLLLVVHLGSVPLFDPDESRFARTTVEMLESRDPIVPRFEGVPRLVKPPLMHWIQAALFQGFGPSAWAARLPAVLSSLVSLGLLAAIARRRFGVEAAPWAAAVLGTMPLFILVGRSGTLDALLAVHILAFVALDLARPAGARGSQVALAAGGLLGLAFLVKGPVGVVLPLIVVLAGRTATGRELLPRPAALLRGALAASVVTLPWALAFVARLGPGRVADVLQQELIDPYLRGAAHDRPHWFYLVVVVVGCFPWAAPLAVGAWRAVRQRHDPTAQTALYATAGSAAGLLLLSLGRNKLPTYILPLVPLMALIVTWEMHQESRRRGSRWFGSILLVATVASAAVLLAMSASRFELAGAAQTARIAGIVLGVSAFAGGWAVLAQRQRAVYASSAAGSALVLGLAIGLLLPALGRERSAVELIRTLPLLTEPRPLVTVEVRVPSLAFYLDRTTEWVAMDRWQQRLREGDDPVFVLADVDLPGVPGEVLDRLQEVGRQGKYIVFVKRADAPPDPDPLDPAGGAD